MYSGWVTPVRFLAVAILPPPPPTRFTSALRTRMFYSVGITLARTRLVVVCRFHSVRPLRLINTCPSEVFGRINARACTQTRVTSRRILFVGARADCRKPRSAAVRTDQYRLSKLALHTARADDGEASREAFFPSYRLRCVSRPSVSKTAIASDKSRVNWKTSRAAQLTFLIGFRRPAPDRLGRGGPRCLPTPTRRAYIHVDVFGCIRYRKNV